MCKKNYDSENLYLKVLRFGICPECLEHCVVTPTSNQGRTVHYHCVNPNCQAYMKDVSMPIGVFDVLCFLEDHQPNLA